MLMTFGGELTAVPGVVLFGSAIPWLLIQNSGFRSLDLFGMKLETQTQLARCS